MGAKWQLIKVGNGMYLKRCGCNGEYELHANGGAFGYSYNGQMSRVESVSVAGGASLAVGTLVGGCFIVREIIEGTHYPIVILVKIK